MELNRIIHNDCLVALKQLPANSIDSVVTDPPYGLSFMSKGWDTFAGNKQYGEWCEQWARECLRVLKPGGYLLAFSGTRTYHRLARGVEDAGFEVRDMIEWLYLSGFPKSMDIGKQFDKQAGADRKVIAEGPTVKRMIPGADQDKTGSWIKDNGRTFTHTITAPATELAKQWDGWGTALKPAHEPIVMARKPFPGTVCANVELYGTAAINIDGCRIERGENDRYDYGVTGNQRATTGLYGIYGKYGAVAYEVNEAGRFPANCITIDADEWYSPYFNISPQEVSKKANKADRGEGNTHPTVKPIDLMAWLIRLVTPPDGVIVDPFAGSGSTLAAAKREGFNYIGIERDAESVQIARARTESESIQHQALVDSEDPNQLVLF
ncbi:DNA-methyltransferase [Gordoniibacillus kamchatkensis]|uniref:DNA-methyltransferase n=1 Tax=Gordoniibacillus kamchatkensis TaxID=1590651 RepID=UPI0006977928|nr:site-specific DNA-methyltransferase [Paenibacillus sp. VKM B-2647]